VSGPIVLGVDPGLASFGYAIVELEPNGGAELRTLGVLHTSKTDAKRKVLASDDSLRRARELDEALWAVINALASRPVVICAESMSFPRSASVAAKMGISWGLIAAFANDVGCPVAQCSPQQMKKILCGASNASKVDVQQALDRRFFPSGSGSLFAGVKKTDREHCADALGAVIACEQHEAMLLARRMTTKGAAA